MSEDIRKTYVLSTAANYFGKNADDFLRFANDKNLAKFLDDINVLVLVVTYSKHEVAFTIKVGVLEKVETWQTAWSTLVFLARECERHFRPIAHLLQAQGGDHNTGELEEQLAHVLHRQLTC